MARDLSPTCLAPCAFSGSDAALPPPQQSRSSQQQLASSWSTVDHFKDGSDGALLLEATSAKKGRCKLSASFLANNFEGRHEDGTFDVNVAWNERTLDFGLEHYFVSDAFRRKTLASYSSG